MTLEDICEDSSLSPQRKLERLRAIESTMRELERCSVFKGPDQSSTWQDDLSRLCVIMRDIERQIASVRP
ncbi:hypothetical protein [Aminobacter aminovorans]|uniref:hypothetical protein n=1 Tax=Aminobacter TaxID=31988 RepID=UPI00285CCF42|nr:hypothetical protein [Aminobacter aminovorans]MDR7219883.1 hypothetical protein [Aminobacter aminovorans]